MFAGLYTRRFFASQLGQAAMVSIAAMATFALLASVPPAHAGAEGPAAISAPAFPVPIVAAMVELA